MVQGERLDHWMIRWWARVLCRIYGWDLVVTGALHEGPVLLVSNHISWVDIIIVLTQRAGCFVAKGEISRWPLLSWIFTQAGTVYHFRGCGQSLDRVADEMTERIRSGLSVAIFPEGGVTEGSGVGRFHPRLFQIAIRSGSSIQPITLYYQPLAEQIPIVGFRSEESFVENFLRILTQPCVRCSITYGNVIHSNNQTRRQLSNEAKNIVEEHYTRQYDLDVGRSSLK